MDKVSLGPKPFMTPMPTVLVGANVEGRPNFMAVAWAGVASMEPPMIAVAINKVRHTEKGIVQNGTFSVNIPSAKNAVETDYCGLVSGKDVEKASVFETRYGKLGTAPMITHFPVNLECQLRHTLELGSHNLHVGEIIDVYVDRECMKGNQPDIAKIDPIVYSQSNYYHVGDSIGRAFFIGKALKK
jgi:flavin reductase (DIM6/NTAB) family NADH-FMN oxidoreductase RutF